MTKAVDITNNVLVGQDGWLFLYSGDQAEFDYLTGDKIPDTTSVDNFCYNIKSRTEFFKLNSITYSHIVFPSKSLVYNDKIASVFNREIDSIYLRSYAPALMKYPGLDVVYPLELYRSSRDGCEPFFKLDTHISYDGSRIIVQEILKRFGLDLNVADISPYTVLNVTGDLATMLGLGDTWDEKFPVRTALSFDNLSALPGNTGNILISCNKSAVYPKRILLIGDSFIKETVYLLSHIFSDVLYVRSENIQHDIINLYGPDFVVTSGVERYLSSVRSDRDGRSVLMSKYGDPDYNISREFSDALRAQLSWKTFPNVYEDWIATVGQ